MNKITKVEYHAINTTEKTENTNFVFRVKCEGVDGWCLIKAAVDLGYISEDFRRFENYHKRTAAAILLPEVLTAAGLPVSESVTAAAANAQKAIDEKRREGLKKQFATYMRGEAAFKADKAAAAAKSWTALRRRCLDMVETAAIVAEVETAAE